MYRNYIFDLYGTLVDVHTEEDDPAVWDAFAGVLAGYGIRAGGRSLHLEYRRLCRRSARRAAEELRTRGIPGPAELEVTGIWRRIALDRGARLTGVQLAEISAAFRRLTVTRIGLFPDALPLLEELRARGRRIVLLSNAQASFTAPEVRALGLEGRFDRVFYSSDYGVLKPSPAFFALPGRSGFDPVESVMIGNDPVCDCLGASRAGMDSLFIRTDRPASERIRLPRGCREIARLLDALPDG